MHRLPPIFVAAVAALLLPSTALAQDVAPPIDPATIVALLSAHSWAALAAVVIPLVLHLAQRGVYPLGLTIPPEARPALVTVLSIAAGVADAVASGTPWRAALAGGVAAALVALRLSPAAPAPGDGQPQANPAGAAPSAPREAPTVPPVVGGLLLVLGGLALAGALVSCTPAQRQQAAQVGGAALAAVDGPACELVEVRSGSALAGVVCSGAAGALAELLRGIGSTSQALTSGDAGARAACRLVPVHAGGAHQGFVCAEHESALVAALARDGGA